MSAAKRRSLDDLRLTTNVAGKRAIKSTGRNVQKNVCHRPLTRSMSTNLQKEQKKILQSSATQEREIENPFSVTTGVTPLQQSLAAVRIHNVSATSKPNPVKPAVVPLVPPQDWEDIDEANKDNSDYAWEYAVDIYQHLRTREDHFRLPADTLFRQSEVTPEMRTALVDWMVEMCNDVELDVQDESLFLAVKLLDYYMIRRKVRKEDYQLVGITALYIMFKVDEASPPKIGELLALWGLDDYTAHDIKRAEREMLKGMDYDFNIPTVYPFFVRYITAAKASFETHVLAHFICESSLQVYEFVSEKASLIAAAAVYLALRMRDLGGWTPTLRHYSNLSVQDLLPMAVRLNRMLSTPWPSHHAVRTKFRNELLPKVSEIPPLKDVEADAKLLCKF